MIRSSRPLPVVLQAAGSECGLACLTMIASYHGHDVNLAGMRGRFPVSMAGSRLSDLIEFAGELGLQTRAVRAPPEDIGYLKTPAILHWNARHFVVLKRVAGRHAIIHDPVSGVRRIPLAALGGSYDGVALELEPREDFAPQSTTAHVSLRDAWGPIRGGGAAVAQVIGLSLLVQVLALAAPLFLQIAVDRATGQGDNGVLFALAMAFGGVFLIKAFAEAARGWTLLYYSNLLNFQMLKRLFSRLLRLPPAYFETRHVGDIMSRMGSARTLQATMTEGFASGLIDVGLGLILIVTIAVYSLPACAVILIASGLLFAINLVVSGRMRVVQEEAIAATASEQSHMMESIRSASTIKLFAKEADRVGAWEGRYVNVVNQSIRLGRYSLSLRFVQEVIMAVQGLAVILIGVQEVLGGRLTVGAIAALVAYSQILTGHLNGFFVQFVQFRLLRVHLGRLADIIHSPLDVGWDGPAAAPVGSHSIALRQVSFRYGAGEPDVLREADLVIEDGSFVALTGRSGSGKSTIVRIILGLLQPTGGDVLVGGRPLSGPIVSAWRADAAAVMQNDRLFSGTLSENIAFFDRSADFERVREAARAADIDDHIMSLPMGYRTSVGDMGSTLSAGQHQRLLLARALYRRPKVLILDEGTANLDPESEARIVKVIQALPVTRIIVAHRPALIDAADSVYTMSDGQPVRLR
ncbi:peptidase domain-containing ABC transporter [Brevundimonas sp. GCM10030266]|uniref:peptidase domain-containing ABC transporter n=1 Tax=Brevundimonas sp. GCM10030266 TaxID=3273386 RepID=UPI00362165D3